MPACDVPTSRSPERGRCAPSGPSCTATSAPAARTWPPCSPTTRCSRCSRSCSWRPRWSARSGGPRRPRRSCAISATCCPAPPRTSLARLRAQPRVECHGTRDHRPRRAAVVVARLLLGARIGPERALRTAEPRLPAPEGRHGRPAGGRADRPAARPHGRRLEPDGALARSPPASPTWPPGGSAARSPSAR